MATARCSCPSGSSFGLAGVVNGNGNGGMLPPHDSSFGPTGVVDGDGDGETVLSPSSVHLGLQKQVSSMTRERATWQRVCRRMAVTATTEPLHLRMDGGPFFE